MGIKEWTAKQAVKVAKKLDVDLVKNMAGNWVQIFGTGNNDESFSRSPRNPSGTLGLESDLEAAAGLLPWVSIAVNALACDVSSQPIKFKSKRTGEEIKWSRVPDQAKMIVDQNYYGYTFKDVLKSAIQYRQLCGNAIFRRISGTRFGESRGLLDTLIPILPYQVRAVTNPAGTALIEYVADLQGLRLNLSPELVVHSKRKPIYSMFWGVGGITEQRIVAEGEVSASEYIAEYVRDAKRLPHIIFIDGVTTDNADRKASYLQDKYSKGLMYTNSEKAQIENISLLNKDIGFMELRGFDRQTVLSTYGVPPIRVGIPDGSNKANSTTQERIYYKSAVNPEILEVMDAFNRQHFNLIDSDLDLDIQLYPTGDIDMIVTGIQNGMITPRAGAIQIGQDASVDDQSLDMHYIGSSYIPTSIASTPLSDQIAPTDQTGKRINAQKKNLFELEELIDDAVKMVPGAKQFQIKYLRASFLARGIMERKYTKVFSDMFDEQKQKVLDAVAKYWKEGKAIKSENFSAELIFDLPVENHNLKNKAKALHTSGVQRSIDQINKITATRTILDTSNPFVLAKINALGTKITGRVNQTTLDGLRGVVTQAVDKGWTINQIQDSISEKFDSWSGYRARMIARTESRAAWDAGAQVAYKNIGVKTVDIIGCTRTAEEEGGGDCAAQDVPVGQMDGLDFHPNHIGVPAPSEEP